MTPAGMCYVSTRGNAAPVTVSGAIADGLAPDGGLYVPESLPRVDPTGVDPDADLAAFAPRLLAPFFSGDRLAAALEAICAEAFTFPAPLRLLAGNEGRILELFYGPTAAFKDFGARFLAACLRRLPGPGGGPLTILVATSGDTGAAVAAAFHRLPGMRVCILYPEGRVSPRQAHLLGCFGENVQALGVAGGFDDCQRLVKRALGDAELRSCVALTSANSISLGRLLPQTVYFARAALQHRRARGAPLNAIVPTGNLGNALACNWARAAGFPIGRIHLACNANAVLPDFFAGAPYVPRPGTATLANAMDVGAPGNFERLRHASRDDAALRAAFGAGSVEDAAIRAVVRRRACTQGEIFCPHTATAVHELERLRAAGDETHWTVVATAHPAKFDDVIEPLIGRRIDVPSALAALLRRPAQNEPLAPDYAALRALLLAASSSSPALE